MVSKAKLVHSAKKTNYLAASYHSKYTLESYNIQYTGFKSLNLAYNRLDNACTVAATYNVWKCQTILFFGWGLRLILFLRIIYNSNIYEKVRLPPWGFKIPTVGPTDGNSFGWTILFQTRFWSVDLLVCVLPL